MNVMKNWGCLNKIKLVGILLAGGLHFIFFLPSIRVSYTSFFQFILHPREEVFHLLDNVISRDGFLTMQILPSRFINVTFLS